jgi:heat shock protein HslJ
MLIAAAVGAVGLVGCGAGSELSGKTFESTSIVAARGTDPPPGAPRRFQLSIHGDGIGWELHCNVVAVEAEFTETRIELGEGESTAVQCNPRETVEEDWLWHFMYEDPEWQLKGSKLRLSTDRAAVEMKPVNDPE